jgi:fucose permease
MDGGLNTAVGLSQRKRLLNLLHGAYGVGTAAGPLLVTAAILAGSWRAAYLALLAVDVVLATLWWAARNTVGQPMARAAPTRAARPGHGRRRRYPRLQVLGGMGVFFVYTGLEVSAGQWETSFGRQHLGLSAAVAGIATFGYWGALTASRLVLAASRRQVPSLWVVRGGSGAAIAATAVIWWQPGVAATLGGFAVLGAALAGIFPAMVALTPIRRGNRRAQDVIAWQIGAAAAGGSGTAALVGVLIGAGGFAVLGPSLLAMAVLLAAGDVAVWGTGRREPPVA